MEAGCCGVVSPGFDLAQQGLELGANGAQGGSYGDALVGAEIVHYSSLAPRTYLCVRLLEALD